MLIRGFRFIFTHITNPEAKSIRETRNKDANSLTAGCDSYLTDAVNLQRMGFLELSEELRAIREREFQGRRETEAT